jgi:23S rRNA (cytidine2498-2'-O)-methyltransferase
LDFTSATNENHLEFLPGLIYQTSPGRETDLAAELAEATPGGETRADWVSDNLVYRANPPERPLFWWRNLWKAPFVFSFSSISKAAAVLRSVQRNWACVPLGHYGRARLIQDALPYITRKRRPLDYKVPLAPVGSWTLVGERTVLASADCASPFPGGIIEFEEDKEGPPSRAYLKLAEVFIRLGTRPFAGETCLDAGASPGGWTWMVMRGCRTVFPAAQSPLRVIAVDRAPLAPSVAAIPHVTFLRHDAFTLRPEDIGMIDWLLCDAACYPARLYRWIEKWLASGLCKNYICTIKMQDTGDMETARLFAAIPGGAVVHLYHNKHELTWMMRSVV